VIGKCWVKAQIFGFLIGAGKKILIGFRPIEKLRKKTRERGCDYEVDFFFFTKKMKLLTYVAAKCVFH
jgi:hypothetical protein